MAAKKKTSKSTDKGITKSGFIRSLPDRTPAREVIAKAKEVGLNLNEKFVWTIQSEMRSKAKGSKPAASKPSTNAAAPKGAKGKKAKAATKTVAASTKRVKGAGAAAPVLASPAEQRLRALIIELGTARAEQVYRAVKMQLDALVGGA